MQLASARLRSPLAHWCRTRCAVPLWKCRCRNLEFVHWSDAAHTSTVQAQTETWGNNGAAGTRAAALWRPHLRNLCHQRRWNRHSRRTIRLRNRSDQVDRSASGYIDLMPFDANRPRPDRSVHTSLTISDPTLENITWSVRWPSVCARMNNTSPTRRAGSQAQECRAQDPHQPANRSRRPGGQGRAARSRRQCLLWRAAFAARRLEPNLNDASGCRHRALPFLGHTTRCGGRLGIRHN